MTDGIIKGTGNSRFLKAPANAMTLYPSYESFIEAMVAGTFPIDLNGINPDGWQTVGNKLDKATLLTDSLCTALGLATTATPTQAMDKLLQLVSGRAIISSGFYIGTNVTGENNPTVLSFPFEPKVVAIINEIPIQSYPNYTIQSKVGGKTTSEYWILQTDTLDTEFRQTAGLGRKTPLYGKTSSDRKTIYWYSGSTDPYDANNSLYYRYYYFAIG